MGHGICLIQNVSVQKNIKKCIFRSVIFSYLILILPHNSSLYPVFFFSFHFYFYINGIKCNSIIIIHGSSLKNEKQKIRELDFLILIKLRINLLHYLICYLHLKILNIMWVCCCCGYCSLFFFSFPFSMKWLVKNVSTSID